MFQFDQRQTRQELWIAAAERRTRPSAAVTVTIRPDSA